MHVQDDSSLLSLRSLGLSLSLSLSPLNAVYVYYMPQQLCVMLHGCRICTHSAKQKHGQERTGEDRRGEERSCTDSSFLHGPSLTHEGLPPGELVDPAPVQSGWQRAKIQNGWAFGTGWPELCLSLRRLGC